MRKINHSQRGTCLNTNNILIQEALKKVVIETGFKEGTKTSEPFYFASAPQFNLKSYDFEEESAVESLLVEVGEILRRNLSIAKDLLKQK